MTSDDSRPPKHDGNNNARWEKPREWWIAPAEDCKSAIDVIARREPFGTHSSKYIHVIEKSAYDQLTQRLEERERELAELKSKNAYLQQNYVESRSDLKIAHEASLLLARELAEAKAALHTTRIIPGTEELHKQLTEARAETERLRAGWDACAKEQFINASKEEMKNATGLLGTLSAENERLKAEVTALDKKILRHVETMETLKHDIEVYGHFAEAYGDLSCCYDAHDVTRIIQRAFEETKAERDRWRDQAEKLAASLKDIASEFCPYGHDEAARKVLAEFEEFKSRKE